MKTLRVGVAFLSATLLVLLFSGTPAAFHSGGVAECVGCHSMHSPDPSGKYLLVGSTASATCLSCHESANDTGPSSYHISTVDAKLATGAPLQRTPGGDFSWVKKSFTWAGGSENGATHGHNVVAIDKGYVVDPTNATAPGGDFPSAQLGCASCHDPHGQARRLADGSIVKTGQPIKASGSYGDPGNEPTATEAVGVYRLLAGKGYSMKTVPNTIFDGAPAAKVPATYNRTEAVTQTRTAYGRSTTGGHVAWGTWCATCHPDMHSSGNYVHPIDEDLGGTVITNYELYVKSGSLTGTAGTSFSSLVPFVEDENDYTVLASHAKNDNSQLGGPQSGDQVSCLSCHRAHASGMMYGLRFDVEYEFMTKAGDYVGTDNPDYVNWGSRAPVQARGRKVADWKAAYYDRPASQFATYQRVLCNKCHAKD